MIRATKHQPEKTVQFQFSYCSEENPLQFGQAGLPGTTAEKSKIISPLAASQPPAPGRRELLSDTQVGSCYFSFPLRQQTDPTAPREGSLQQPQGKGWAAWARGAEGTHPREPAAAAVLSQCARITKPRCSLASVPTAWNKTPAFGVCTNRSKLGTFHSSPLQS